MATLRLLLVFCILTCGHCWWPFSSAGDDVKDEEDTHTAAQLEMVRFEMRSAEQKFLAEAQQFLDMSALERCQYQVIARLRQSCGELGEEELGKLSVALLNCQSQTEGRQTFPCTEYMTLGECTGPMDAHMWNAYHIVSNRARSVCYAARQQQFRRQTEMAVNHLSRSTLEQLEAMEKLGSSQQEIQLLAERSVDTMTQHQDSLLQQQRELFTSHAGLQGRIEENLQQLTQEKALIHTGQEQLTNMTSDIKHQLELASGMLSQQEVNRREGHSKIMSDITAVRANIQDVWERLDNSTEQLLTVMEDISQQYQSTLDNLRLINSSVTSMLALVSSMDAAINSQLQWVVEQLGGAQDGLRTLITCATHACFLLIATLCVLFVRAPALTRIILLVSVIGNAISELRFRTSFNLYTLTALQIAVLTGNWLYVWIVWRKQSKEDHRHLFIAGTQSPPPLPPPATYNPSEELDSDLDDTPTSTEATCSVHDNVNPHPLHVPIPGLRARLHRSAPREAETLSSSPTKISPSSTPTKPVYLPSTPTKPTSIPADSVFASLTPTQPTLAGSAVQSTPRQRQCMGITRTGLKCRLPATPGSTRCRRHAN